MQRQEWIEQYHQSGLSLEAFAREHGLKPGTLYYWVLQAKRNRAATTKPVLFKEIGLPPAQPRAGSDWAIEVLTPSGLILRLR